MSCEKAARSSGDGREEGGSVSYPRVILRGKEMGNAVYRYGRDA